MTTPSVCGKTRSARIPLSCSSGLISRAPAMKGRSAEAGQVLECTLEFRPECEAARQALEQLRRSGP